MEKSERKIIIKIGNACNLLSRWTICETRRCLVLMLLLLFIDVFIVIFHTACEIHSDIFALNVILFQTVFWHFARGDPFFLFESSSHLFGTIPLKVGNFATTFSLLFRL